MTVAKKTGQMKRLHRGTSQLLMPQMLARALVRRHADSVSILTYKVCMNKQARP